jgi:hypothetical protein
MINDKTCSVKWIISMWDNGSKYKREYGPYYTYEEAKKKYDEYLGEKDNVELVEFLSHTEVIESKMSE